MTSILHITVPNHIYQMISMTEWGISEAQRGNFVLMEEKKNGCSMFIARATFWDFVTRLEGMSKDLRKQDLEHEGHLFASAARSVARQAAAQLFDEEAAA